MRTTIAVRPAVREELAVLKRRMGASSLEEVIGRLLAGPARTAESLFRERKARIRQVLRRHGVRRLVAFGSRARGEGRPDSDLDLAAALPASADLFDIVHLRDDLSQAFGVEVDLVSLGGASRALRSEIDKGVVLVG